MKQVIAAEAGPQCITRFDRMELIIQTFLTKSKYSPQEFIRNLFRNIFRNEEKNVFKYHEIIKNEVHLDPCEIEQIVLAPSPLKSDVPGVTYDDTPCFLILYSQNGAISVYVKLGGSNAVRNCKNRDPFFSFLSPEGKNVFGEEGKVL